MTTAITRKEKKTRGFDSLVNQFASEEKSAHRKEPENLIEKLNRMIEAGASFDVTAECFEIVSAENLRDAEKDFLTVNRIAILCTLQQALLMKHLFSVKPELLRDFIAKVNERDARFEAVCDITGKWFARLLETVSDQASFEDRWKL